MVGAEGSLSNLAVNKMVVLKAGDPLNKGWFFFSKNICENFDNLLLLVFI